MLRTTQWIAAIALISLLLSAESAFAHADYDRSQPARNEVLPEPPTQVDVWFTQEVFRREGANFVRVFDEQEMQVSAGDGVVDDDDRTHIFTTLEPDLPPGRYILRWMTLSDIDGDSDEGAFCFYVAVEPSAEQQAQCAEISGEEAGSPSPVATEVSPAATATPATIDNAADEDDNGAPVAAIVGIVVGIAAVVVVVGGLVLWRRSASG